MTGILPNGPELVIDWVSSMCSIARQCGSRRIGGTRLKKTKNVNAKTYTLGSSKISFKRINTASARREAVLA